MTHRLAMAAVCVVVCLGIAAQEPVVIVQFRIDASFKETPVALNAFRRVTDALPARQVAVKPGETINEVIDRLYDWGKSDRPRTFDILEKRIRTLNDNAYLASTKDGYVLIPDVPDWAMSKFNADKPVNRVPQITTWTEKQIRLDDKGIPILFGTPSILASGRKASQFAIREYASGMSEANAILERAGSNASALNYPISLKLAAPEGQSSSALTVVQSDEIRKLLKDATRRSIVVVADTGWPDSTRRDEALILLRELINVARTKIGLTPLSSLKPGAFTPLSNSHAARIQAALLPFTSLDEKKAIQVVFVPLTKAQGAGPVIEEIIKTHYLLDVFEAAGGSASPTADDVKKAASNAATIMRNIPDNWLATEPSVRTDKFLMDAYLRLLNHYAQYSSTKTFFFNESWTAPNQRYTVYHPDPLRGAVVAASGNENENLSDGTVDFAQRSIRHSDTIAVMNIDEAGVACDSGRVNLQDLPNTFIVGFDGRVSAGDCANSGTSFAAPRVAWLFAAAETIRKTPLSYTSWGNTQRDYIRSLRAANGGIEGTKLDPVAFLKGIAALP